MKYDNLSHWRTQLCNFTAENNFLIFRKQNSWGNDEENKGFTITYVPLFQNLMGCLTVIGRCLLKKHPKYHRTSQVTVWDLLHRQRLDTFEFYC